MMATLSFNELMKKKHSCKNVTFAMPGPAKNLIDKFLNKRDLAAVSFQPFCRNYGSLHTSHQVLTTISNSWMIRVGGGGGGERLIN